MCAFLLEARWWGLVCDGGQQWPQTLNREASVALHPSDTHTQTDLHSTFVYPSAPARQRSICYVSHIHILPQRVHSEVLNWVRQWISVTPRSLHLQGGLHCQRHKRGHPGCYVTDSHFGNLEAHPSFRLSLCWIVFAPHLPQISEDASASLSGPDPLRQGFPLESQLMTSTELSSHPQLHFPARRELKKRFRVCQVKWMFRLFECGRCVFKTEIWGEIACWNCNGHSGWSTWFVSGHGCCFRFDRCW